MDSDHNELFSYGKKIKELTDIQQFILIFMLLEMATNGNLPKGSLAKLADKF